MNVPIRVAQVVGRMMGGGVEATVMNHYRHVDHDRVQFDFIVQDDSTVVPAEEIESLGGRVFEIPSYKRLPAYMKACERLFRELRPSIVHSHMNSLSVFPLKAAKDADVPVRIAHSHSTSNPREYAKTAMKMVLRPFSRVYPTHYAACSR
ncbi:glycosyltransferase, partial [Bifidobacterium imperatoris]